MSLVETILLTLFLAIFLYYFLTFVFSKSNDKNKQQKLNKIKKKIGLSLDDLALFDKKYKPMALNWIKTKTNATLKFLGGKAQRGDGLVSIFTDSHESATDMDSSKIRIRNVRSQILSESQAIAFDSLFTWGIFEGAEISILNELCSNSTTINRKAGEIIFAETDSPSEFLYVLQSGTCDISFQGPDGSRKVIHTIGDGGVLASVADVISWITRTDTSRGGVYAQCVTDCMLIAIPSPRDISGKYQSRLHTITFSRITRMLLIRFNRTTITTALFYLGLAQHFPPSFPKIEIPQDLIALLSASDDSFDPMSGTHHKDCIKFVREAIASLYGVLPSEVELPYQKTSTVPNPLLSAPSPLSRARSFSSCEEAAMNAADLDPYFPTSRIVPEELGVRQRTGICRMREGQSIFDVDPIPGLYIIVSGKVEIRYRIIQKGQPSPLMRDQSLQEPSSQLSYLSARETSASIVSTGEIIGHVTLLAGSSTEWYGRSDGTSSPLMSAKALTDTWLIRVPVETFDKTLASRPDAIFDLSARMMSVLPPTVRLFDFCTKWITLQGGEDIVKRGQPSTGELFIILCGRLRVLMNEHEVESEENQTWNTRTQGADWILTRGTLIGDTQLLTGEPYTHTFRAIRRTALSVVPFRLLDFITHQYPSVMTSIIRNVSNKQTRFMKLSTLVHYPSCSETDESKTLMVAPISGSVPLDLVCSSLKLCLEKCAQSVLLVTSSDAASIFGGVLSGLSEYEVILTLGSWMHQLEIDYDIVLYQADWHHTAWNKLCASQCDEILLIANSFDAPTINSSEERIHAESGMIPKTLVMLHTNPESEYPVGTRKWIETRTGVRRHVHVRLFANDKSFDPTHFKSDFNRLARILTNTAVGLVLGGGGARGMSHLGVIQALEEKGIPIDMIGGTSIGSFVGGLYACEQSIEKVDPIARRWAEQGSSLWFYLMDLTFPITSYFNGYNFTRALRKVFGMKKIEDFWINYYCVTTDLTSHDERVHVNGTAYRYIRASMSLANFLPPLCEVDPKNNTLHYLVDGGYVNTVPVDIMKQRFGAKTVIAVDVSGEWSLSATHNYGDNLSGAFVLLSQWNPFIKAPNVPSMADIATQIAFVSACRQIRRVRGIADLYILPPVDKYSVLDFHCDQEIRQIGLDYGREAIANWLESLPNDERGRLSWLSQASQSKNKNPIERKT